LTGEGAKPADVTIYGVNGSDDIAYYAGLTVSSDPEKYSMIQDGEYKAFHQQMGTSVYGKDSLTYRISDMKGSLDLHPIGGINKYNGTSIMTEIFLHRTDTDGRATRASVGCLVIDGRKLRVSKEFQQPFLTDMEKVFGNKTEQFRFDDSGIMSIEEGMKKFTDGLTPEQKKVFKGVKKVLTSRNTTSVVYADEYELTINNDKTSHDISTEFGGGVYSKNDDVIVVSPNVGVVEVTLDQFPFNSEIVEQNTTSTLFHEIAERNIPNIHYRGNVIDYENIVRKIIGIPQRPYDLNHTNSIETNYQ